MWWELCCMGNDVGVVEMESAVVDPGPPLRLLNIPRQTESRWSSALSLLLALAVTAGFFLFIHHYYAPGPGDVGIDENAYLVGGKMVAQHGTPALKPDSPFAYVGPMWIVTADGSFHPKYPAGVPLLNAIAIWSRGGDPAAAYYVSPICGTLAVLGMFFVARPIVGSLCALFATVLLATNPSLLHLSLVPSSHAPAIACTVLGMAALVHWWRTGFIASGIAAGFLIGFTFTIRYTDGLLLAPLGIAALTTVHFKQWRSWRKAAVPVVAWCVPVLVLLVFNRITMGHWTGYDTTNESTGFTAEHFVNKWQFTIQQLHLYGLFFVLPLGLLGMTVMLASARWWKVGLILILWFVPSVLLYMAYYWGQQMPGLAYLRFFLTVYPAAILAAVWVLAMVVRAVRTEVASAGQHTARSWSVGIGAAAFTLMIAGIGVFASLDDLRRLRDLNQSIAFSTKSLFDAVPAARASSDAPPPLMFVEDVGVFSRLLMHFQFAAKGEWFSATAFTPRGARQGMLSRAGGPGGQGRNGQDNTDTPVLIQAARIAKTQELYKGRLASDLAKDEALMINAALAKGRSAYAILTPASTSEFQRRMKEEGFETTILTSWTEPDATPNDPNVPQPTTRPATSTSTSQPSRDEPGMFSRFRPDGMFNGDRGGNRRRGPGGPGGFGGANNNTLIMPAMRIPRLFDTASTYQVLQITAKPSQG